jgi:very-short-patch-repair endonuclease
MITEHVLFFYMLGVGLLAFIFHKMGEKSKDVPPTEYRKLASLIERRLYNALVLNGCCVQTQVTCGPYRSELVIGRLAIECDEKAYHSSPQQKAHNRRKDAYLRKQGYKVMRISGSSIVNRMPQVLKRVKTRLN